MPTWPQPNPLGQAPCDDCELAQHCKARLEACAAFVLYVNLFNERRWRAAPREPQRVTYLSLMRRPRRRSLRSPDAIIPTARQPAQ